MDILGLPVISITEGKELGIVKDVIINAANGSVAGLVVDDGKWYLGAKLLPFSAIAGLGEYAVTIDSSSHVIPVTTSPEMESLLAADVKVIEAKVLTKSGRIQGKVTEIIIDASGKITACEMEETGGETTHIPAQRVITYGKEVLIIAEGNDEPVLAAATARTSAIEPAAVQIPVQATETQTEQQASVTAVAPVEPASDDSSRKFDEKHRKYLLGKKASRRIETDNGMVIVEQGGEITEEVLQKAKLAGKFVELSMSIQ